MEMDAQRNTERETERGIEGMPGCMKETRLHEGDPSVRRRVCVSL